MPPASVIPGQSVDRVSKRPTGGQLRYSEGHWRGIVGREIKQRFASRGTIRAAVQLAVELISGLKVALRHRLVEKSFRVDSAEIPYPGLIELFFGGENSIPLHLRLANVLSKLKGERAVEIPFALHFYRKYPHSRLLEVGNVLAFYVRISPKETVDKYDASRYVSTVDILEWDPSPRYDMVVSISTVEHIGWDEAERDASKSVIAIHRMRAMLIPDGKMLVTVPLNYNPAVDDYVRAAHGADCNVTIVARKPQTQRWVQVSLADSADMDSVVAFMIFSGQPR